METILLLGFLGLALGSFSNVCIYRLPAEQSLFRPRSRCSHCLHPVAWFDNVPVLSYLWLRGQCRFCHTSLSLQYPIIELLMGIAFAGAAWLYKGETVELTILLVLLFFWINTTIIDIRHRILPDEFTLSLLVFGWTIAWWNPLLGSPGMERLVHSVAASLGSGAGMLALAWIGEKLFKKEALGGGDVKLLAGTGAVLGWSGVFGTLFIGSLCGGLFGLVMLAFKQKKLGETIPFGPFLNLGMAVSYFFPDLWKRLFYAGF